VSCQSSILRFRFLQNLSLSFMPYFFLVPFYSASQKRPLMGRQRLNRRDRTPCTLRIACGESSVQIDLPDLKICPSCSVSCLVVCQLSGADCLFGSIEQRICPIHIFYNDAISPCHAHRVEPGYAISPGNLL